ncbi:MAG: NAD(P)-dependent alcohol dehydrogenase [Proteobacteria bacterium]|nr:NAD(P)-dependent alcohol dehydrogenase [Pseudomonadota bacterium]
MYTCVRAIVACLAVSGGGWLGTPARAANTPLPPTTRQVVLAKDGAGHYAWSLVQAPLPRVGDHQVLLHVHAVALQHGELELLESLNKSTDTERDRSGQIVCSDAAGEVAAIGRQVTSTHVGARVTSLYFADYLEGPLTPAKQAQGHGYGINGVLGDYVLLEDTGIAPMPGGMSYEEAATLPTAALTAWMATVGSNLVPRGGTVLVEGTGGISWFALQISSAYGARVIVTSSSDEKLERARSYGAHDGINYKSVPAWGERVLELTDGRGADVVVDIGGKSTMPQSLKSLAYGGTLSLVGGLGGYGADIPAIELIRKAARAQGIYAGSRADYLRMTKFFEALHLHPLVDHTYPLEDYPTALKDLAAGNFMGKLVIRL